MNSISNYKTVFSISAKNDLYKIFSYYRENQINTNLQKFINQLNNVLSIIEEYPSSGIVTFTRHNYTFRKMILINHIIIYYVDEESKILNIFRIFHQSEDYQKKLSIHERVAKHLKGMINLLNN